MSTEIPVSRTGATDREVEAARQVLRDAGRPVLAEFITAQHLDASRAAASPDRDPVVDAWTKLHDGQPVHVSELAPAAEVNSGPLREFAEFVVSLDDDDPESPGRQARRTVTLAQLVDRARAALLAEQIGGGK